MTQSKFLSIDRALKDGFVLHPKDEESLALIKEAAASPLPQDMQKVMKQGGFITPASLEEHGSALNLYFEIMHGLMWQLIHIDPEMAGWAKDLRVGKRYSWRMVAQAFTDKSGAPWDPAWNQIGGMALCRAAAEKLEEKWDEPPWN